MYWLILGFIFVMILYYSSYKVNYYISMVTVLFGMTVIRTIKLRDLYSYYKETVWRDKIFLLVSAVFSPVIAMIGIVLTIIDHMVDIMFRRDYKED